MHKESTVDRKQILPQLIAVRRGFFSKAYVVAKAVHNFLD
jgi:hypothetical protein